MDTDELIWRLDNDRSLCPGEHEVYLAPEGVAEPKLVGFRCSVDSGADRQMELGTHRHVMSEDTVGDEIQAFMKDCAIEHERAVARRLLRETLGLAATPAEDPNVVLQRKLYSTRDAMVWAEEFCRIAADLSKEQADIFDPGWVVGWFANYAQTVLSFERGDGGL